MVAMCVQRDTDATAKMMANYTLPYERLYFTGQEHSGLPAVELMVHERKTDSSWQVSRARTSSKPWTALTTAAIGGQEWFSIRVMGGEEPLCRGK
jgi:hypothetical protein